MYGDNDLNHSAQEYGSCQPSYAYCNNNGEFNYVAKINFGECDYQGVKDADTGVQLSNSVIEYVITDEISAALFDSEQALTLFNFFFHADSY